MHILAQFEIPKSWPKWKRDAALLGIYTPGRPDIDNVAKAVLDAFNGIVYKDDAQVYELTVKKIYGQPLMVATVSWSDD
jgi:Holliday junction resolvase RusA-like endonuclease